MNNKSKITILLFTLLAVLAWVYKDQMVDFYVAQQNKKNAPTVEALLFKEVFVASDEETNQLNAQKVMARSLDASIKTDTIQIDSCIPTPKVAKVSYDKDISFKNVGAKDLTISFTQLKDLVIPAGKDIVINTKSISYPNRKPGSFSSLGYTCGNSSTRIGYITITD